MKKMIIVLLASVVLFALVGCNNKNAEEYKSNIRSVADKMLENSSKAEEILNLYSSVWNYSIKSRGAIPVSEMAALTGLEQDVINEYFEINNAGNIPKDFSTNIHSLKSYYEGTGKLEELKNASNDIKTKMADLKEPPEEYEKAYDEILDMYNYSEKYIEMVLNPSGSYQSFTAEEQQLSSDILSKYKRIEVIVPKED